MRWLGAEQRITPVAKKNRILFTDDLHYSHKN